MTRRLLTYSFQVHFVRCIFVIAQSPAPLEPCNELHLGFHTPRCCEPSTDDTQCPRDGFRPARAPFRESIVASAEKVGRHSDNDIMMRVLLVDT